VIDMKALLRSIETIRDVIAGISSSIAAKG
jgi:hypothetical protein